MVRIKKAYSVTIIAWSAYQIDMQAKTQDEAIAMAEAAYLEDTELFHFRDGGITDVSAD